MKVMLSALLALFALLAVGCNIGAPDLLPTAVNDTVLIATAAPSPRQSPSPEPTTPQDVSPTVQIATAAPTETATPLTPSASPSPTSVYLQYLVQEGESLFYILQLPQHGYGYEPDVAATVVALNDNIPNADSLRGGITILIPRPTATPTPLGAQATQELLATIGADDSSGAVLPIGAIVGCHNVKAGETMVDVASQYNTTLEILAALNRDVNWYGCNFTLPSGGTNCAPNLSIDQCVTVPLPTPLPTKRPTPTGNETATPTATKLAPRLLYPPDGALIPAEPVILQWVGLSGMGQADQYLIQLSNQSTRQQLNLVTKANAYQIPDSFAPAAGQAQLFQWYVTVARQNDLGTYEYVGAPGRPRSFTWQSR